MNRTYPFTYTPSRKTNRKLLATTSTGEEIYTASTPSPQSLIEESWNEVGRSLNKAMDIFHR